MISFTVEIEPVTGQQHNQTGRGRNGRPNRYTTAKGKAYRREIALKARQHRPEKLFTDPVHLELDFYRPRAQKRPKWVAKDLWDSGRRIPYRLERHDLDNMAKPFIDALIGDFWAGDGVITSGNFRRFYHEDGGSPRVEVRIQDHIDDEDSK